MKSVLLRGREKATCPQRQRLEWCSHHKLETAGMSSSLEPPGGARPCWHFHIWPLVSKTEKKRLLQVSELVVTCYSSHRKLIQSHTQAPGQGHFGKQSPWVSTSEIVRNTCIFQIPDTELFLCFFLASFWLLWIHLVTINIYIHTYI